MNYNPEQMSHWLKKFKVIPAKSTLNILTHVCFKNIDGIIYLYGTDLNSGISVNTGIETDLKGFTVDYRKFQEVNGSLSGEVELNLENGQLFIECGRSKFKLPVMDVEEFPKFPDIKGTTFEVKSDDPFLAALVKAAKFTSTDEMRPILNGVNVSVIDDKYAVAATDGHRLVEFTGDLVANDFKAILTVDGINMIPKIESDLIRVLINDTFMAVGGQDVIAYSRTIEGDYVTYNDVIQKYSYFDLPLDGEPLQAFKQALVVSDGLTHQIEFLVAPSECTIKAFSNENEFKSTIPLDVCERQGVWHAALNGKYLNDFLSLGKVSLQINKDYIGESGVTAPINLTIDDGAGVRALVMPIRL